MKLRGEWVWPVCMCGKLSLTIVWCVFVCRYKKQLAQARRLGVLKGVSVGISLGLTYFVIFASYGFSFW